MPCSLNILLKIGTKPDKWRLQNLLFNIILWFHSEFYLFIGAQHRCFQLNHFQDGFLEAFERAHLEYTSLRWTASVGPRCLEAPAWPLGCQPAPRSGYLSFLWFDWMFRLNPLLDRSIRGKGFARRRFLSMGFHHLSSFQLRDLRELSWSFHELLSAFGASRSPGAHHTTAC